MLSHPIANRHRNAAVLLAAAFVAVVGTALAFEHIGGFSPCALCLQQREPYYAAIPVALAAALAAQLRWPACITRGGLAIAGLLMTYGLVLSAYHAGVEWAWWPGPADCVAAATSGIATDAGSLLEALDTVRPPSCDEAALRILGLSFAGWNVLASLALGALAFRMAVKD